MKLNDELIRIQNGDQGEGMRKNLETQITYGEALGAKEMVKITGPGGHVVFGSAPVTWKPVFHLADPKPF